MAKLTIFIRILGVGFILVQMTYLRPPLNSPDWVHTLRYPTCSCRPKIGQIVYLFMFLGVIGLCILQQLEYILFDSWHVTVGKKWPNWLIWGYHWIPKLKYMLVDTLHVILGQKMAKLAIFHSFQGFKALKEKFFEKLKI